ncbi:MAG: DUF4430 domain-containing protein [Prevotellaceae bacterium]|jgi:hypothetical protein|nr:DUF4430 domain-containing protein [Prevotellaceae bacterium]
MKKVFTFLAVLLCTVNLFGADIPNITSAQIQYWAGSGSNQAIFTVFFDEDADDDSKASGYSWGYKWEGSKTVQQMLQEINAADSRISFSGLNGANAFIDGIWYDGHNSSVNYIGWMYYCNNQMAAGISNQAIANGDYITFYSYMTMDSDLDTYPVSSVPDPNGTTPSEPRFKADQIQYWIGSGSNQAILIVNFCDNNVGLAYGYRFNGTPTINTMLVDINAADSRLTFSGLPGMLLNYSYNDGTHTYTESSPYPWVSLDEGMPSLNDAIANGSIVETGGDCAEVNWQTFNSVKFSTPVAAASNPNAPANYTVTAVSGWDGSAPYGTISPAGNTAVAAGGNVTYTFTANEGYHLGSVTLGASVDVTADVVNNAYTIQNVTADTTITALFINNPNNTITTDDIVYWIGQGDKKAILAVNWCTKSFAWGYKFNGDNVIVADVLAAIKAVDSRFDYAAASGWLSNITYQDNDYNLTLVGDYWMYNVNENGAMGIDNQSVANNDVIEFGDESCGRADDYWNYVWTAEITPVAELIDNATANANIDELINIYYSNNNINVKINGLQGDILLTITDISGKLIEKTAFEVNNAAEKQISTNNFAKGVYFITLQNKTALRTQKLIVY